MSGEILRKYIDIISEQETLNEEILEEGMLQKLAGLALGTVLALGPKIGQADTVYSYFDPGSNKMQTVLDMSKVPASAKTVMSIDTDTQQVMLVRSGSPTAKEIKPDPVAVKQAQYSKDTKSFVELPKPEKSSQEPEKTQQVSDLSQYSVKGIRFGMNKNELSKVADVRMFGINTTIGGISNWTPKYEDNKLVDLYSFPNSDDMEEILETYTKAYGKPELIRYKSKTKGGLELNDFSATWKVKDAIITMSKYVNRDTGYVGITLASYKDKQAQANQAEKEKKSRDF